MGAHALTAMALVTAVGACAPSSPSSHAAAIEEAVDAFFAAYEAGDTDSVATFFTDDALLMPPGAPTVEGRAAITTAETPVGMAGFDDSGRFLIHWSRAGGRWRIAHYMANRTR